MNKKRKVVKQHTPPDRDPIILSVGEAVEVINRETGHPEWQDWVWCVSISSGLAGWVPKQYLDAAGSSAIATKQYSANELAANPGDELEIYYHLNGWAWCVNAAGRQGWVPEENLEM